MQEYTIEKGVPLVRPVRRVKYPLDSMEIGDSFLASDAKANNMRAIIYQYRKRVAGNTRFVIRTIPEGVRVWRVE